MQLRCIVRPGGNFVGEPVPIEELMRELRGQLAELKAYKEDAEASFAPA